MARVLLSVCIHCYSLAVGVFRFVAVRAVGSRPRWDRWDLRERDLAPRVLLDRGGRSTVWLHASSLGECKLLLSFLHSLRQKYPEALVVLTAVTRSGVTYLGEHLPEGTVAVGHLPYDTIGHMGRIIKGFGVSRVWLMETEIWPSMLWTCVRHGVSVGIVNARMELVSHLWYGRFRLLLRPLFAALDPVLVQTEAYAARFRSMGVEPRRIRVVGNLKRQVRMRRPAADLWNSLRRSLALDEKAVVLTAGCVHPGEGAVLREALELLRPSLDCKLLVVPRHIEAAKRVAEEFGDEVALLSEPRSTQSWHTCVVAKYGILDDMYALADAAFIGGTFVDVGGHNPWDAAQYGIPVFFGPKYHTQTESCRRLSSAGVGFGVNHARELAQALKLVLLDESQRFIAAQQAFARELDREQVDLASLLP